MTIFFLNEFVTFTNVKHNQCRFFVKYHLFNVNILYKTKLNKKHLFKQAQL